MNGSFLLKVILFSGGLGWLVTASAGPVVETARLRVELRDDLNGFIAITDKQTGRNYASAETNALGLYRLHVEQTPVLGSDITSLDAMRRNVTKLPNGLELQFEHGERVPLKVVLRATIAADGAAIQWTCRVQNNGKEPVTAVEFPRVNCTVQLGDSAGDDGIVYPLHEGVLLAAPAWKMADRGGCDNIYPGQLSAQFLYFFDPAGGFYCAAQDGEGHTKTISVKRMGKSLLLGITHHAPRVATANLEIPYPIVWACGGGRWEDGAEIYRAWAERQPWCAQKLVARSVPAWLKRANVFLNFTVTQFTNAAAADQMFARYHEFFQTPVVACGFGWEKYGTWIGPDFFPPVNGEDYYVDLAKRLAQRGDHAQVFTSGFRWGVRKPVSENVKQPRKYTNYDGMEKFRKEGQAATACDASGKLIFKQPAWADNYTLCTGSEQACKILAECFEHVYRWGVAGVDLDQNIGGEVSECFNREHGHPLGRGVWQYQAMRQFLEGIQQRGKAMNPESFVGVEEPCEAYLQLIDVYHGRIFADTRWPVSGPGAVAIPLYLYLYHEYQPGYAGWIDTGFSPFGLEKYGLGRAFIFGMLPGVRVTKGGGLFDLNRTPISDELKILRNMTRLLAANQDALLLGRMLPAPIIKGVPDLVPPASGMRGETRRGDTGAAQKRGTLPVRWPVVQATAWQSVDGKGICYALANLSEQSQQVALGLLGRAGASVALKRKGYALDGETSMQTVVKLPLELPLELKPWEVLVVRQDDVSN